MENFIRNFRSNIIITNSSSISIFDRNDPIWRVYCDNNLFRLVGNLNSARYIPHNQTN